MPYEGNPTLTIAVSHAPQAVEEMPLPSWAALALSYLRFGGSAALTLFLVMLVGVASVGFVAFAATRSWLKRGRIALR